MVTEVEGHFFGLQQYEDRQDRNYQLAELIEEPAPVTRQHPAMRGYRNWWSGGWWGDQNTVWDPVAQRYGAPWCVAYALLHELADGPTPYTETVPAVAPFTLYCEAQRRDPWVGDCEDSRYEGTSVRAGAKYLRQLGLIREYRWAWDMETVVNALLHKGSLIVGSGWYAGMMEPDENGFIHATGPDYGGHAYKVGGINLGREFVRIKNSWGRDWGHAGHAKLSLPDLEKLLDDHGEATYLVPAF